MRKYMVSTRQPAHAVGEGTAATPPPLLLLLLLLLMMMMMMMMMMMAVVMRSRQSLRHSFPPPLYPRS
jgi:hypothetical protein